MELCKSTRLSFTETGAISVIPVPKPTESQGYSSISANCNLTPPPLPSQPYVNRQIHDWHRENATPANKAETRQLANHTQPPLPHTESLLIASFPTGHERFAATILHIFLSLVTLVKEGAVFGKSETRKACRLLDKLAPGPKKLFTCGEILFDLVPSPNRTCRLFAEAMHYDSASGANAMRSFYEEIHSFMLPHLSVAIINCFIHFTTVEMIDQGLSYLRWTLLMWKDAKPEVQRRSKDIMASLREEGLDDSLELETTFSFLHTKPQRIYFGSLDVMTWLGMNTLTTQMLILGSPLAQ
ncbi:hypothetical protein BLNAU_23700 [Blattamonas nauphoetae]|uniref:Uncharacterized protein n=1 Tax=Blattamonas nauphoetae TaxID=2049346 RepID=A0ABQ9WRJ6_9EUKA|nr:hypothetical protein BLNAU_23700 [Blattamonas nauphoetae]